ncbi:Phosphatidylserine decarboxylase proenzyme [Candidatus Hartigia pinicola]|nr:Phosphatidylserine decarboxylase proenzyme [Candidatus Hartigia pinicola]
MLEKIKIRLQCLLPKQSVTILAGWFSDKNAGFITLWIIRLFVKVYKVNMNEAKKNKFTDYQTFNDFFVRSLQDDARPVVTERHQLAQPADGIVSQLGSIQNNQIFQAKNYYYTLEALLAGNYLLADKFRYGKFITTYLSPRDYHRVHMPYDGLLNEMIYVPGDLFSVSSRMVATIPNLFARNERLICVFKTGIGLIIQILVGATIVGSIETVWSGTINVQRKGVFKCWLYSDKATEKAIFLKKGEEMGRFKLGSTVINLFEYNTIRFNSLLLPGCATRMGALLAETLENN